jgi:formylglycine-generating enzyme
MNQLSHSFQTRLPRNVVPRWFAAAIYCVLLISDAFHRLSAQEVNPQIVIQSIRLLEEDLQKAKTKSERRDVGRRILHVGAPLLENEMAPERAKAIAPSMREGGSPTNLERAYFAFWLVRAMGALAADEADAGTQAAETLKTLGAGKGSSDVVVNLMAGLNAKGWLRGGTGTLDDAKVGQTYEVTLPGGVKMIFCYCPPGRFIMGSHRTESENYYYHPDTDAQKEVAINLGFWMGRTEVTQGQWKAVIGKNPSHFPGNDQRPVEQVSWHDAMAFIAKLNEIITLPGDWRFSLPTEIQWEYACRAGTKTVFHFGNSFTGKEAHLVGTYVFKGNQAYPEYGETSGLSSPSTVGRYPANQWGLYDMHGNVFEWCLDKLSTGDCILRGGSWYSGSSFGRSGCRYVGVADEALGSHSDRGFRVALVSGR